MSIIPVRVLTHVLQGDKPAQKTIANVAIIMLDKFYFYDVFLLRMVQLK